MARCITSLLLALLSPVAMASFNEAMDLYRRKEYAAALAEFRGLVEIGDHSSQFNIGAMYYQGQSVEQDPVQGYAWMALANQADDPTWRSARDRVKPWIE